MTEEIIINNKCFIASQTDLKEYMDNITDAFYCEVDKCDEVIKLKQENKELKALNKKICEDWEKEIKVYWNALEEIREIEVLAYYPKGVPEEPLSQRDFTLGAINEYEKRRIKILNKINEVLNES